MKRTQEKEDSILAALERTLDPFYRIEHCKGGHDAQHIKRMLNIAERIFIPGQVDLFLLKVAIWFHNLDRSRRFTGHKEIYIRRILETLTFNAFDAEEIDLIVDAVEKHNRLNDPSDSILLQYLMDCDRLDMGAIGVLRIGALRGQELPLWLPEDFQEESRSTAEKHLGSLVHDIQRCLEWEAMLRTPKAKVFGSVRFTFLKLFLEQIKQELMEIGFLPKPKG